MRRIKNKQKEENDVKFFECSKSVEACENKFLNLKNEVLKNIGEKNNAKNPDLNIDLMRE